MSEEKRDPLKKAEMALSNLPFREPDWEALADRIAGSTSAGVSEDASLFDAPLPRTDADGEPALLTAAADDSVPVPQAAASTATEGLTAHAASEDSPPRALRRVPEAPRETVSLAELARASLARRGTTEKANIAKESLAVASQSRAQSDQIAQRVQAAADYPHHVPPQAAPSSIPPTQPGMRHLGRSQSAEVLKGPWPGVIIAAVGLAAGFALFLSRPEAPAPVTIVQPAPESAARVEAPRPDVPDPGTETTPAPERAGDAPLDPTSLPALPRASVATAEASAGATETKSAGAGTKASAPQPAADAPAVASSRSVVAETIILEEDSKTAARPGSSSSPTTPRPADSKLRPAELGSESVGEKPSAGAAQAAVGSVLGAARTCIAGHPQPSTAQIVFGSDGQVSSVAVGGPAAGTPAAACIESSLKKARVQPFAAPSFSLSVTVRPP